MLNVQRLMDGLLLDTLTASTLVQKAIDAMKADGAQEVRRRNGRGARPLTECVRSVHLALLTLCRTSSPDHPRDRSLKHRSPSTLPTTRLHPRETALPVLPQRERRLSSRPPHTRGRVEAESSQSPARYWRAGRLEAPPGRRRSRAREGRHLVEVVVEVVVCRSGLRAATMATWWGMFFDRSNTVFMHMRSVKLPPPSFILHLLPLDVLKHITQHHSASSSSSSTRFATDVDTSDDRIPFLAVISCLRSKLLSQGSAFTAM